MTRNSWISLAIAGLSFGALAAAGVLQAVWNLEPCTMCIIQRYAFLVIGLLAMASLRVHEPRAVAAMNAVSTLVAGVGVMASLRVQWAISVPSASCGRDKVAAAFNSLPWVDWWPSMFEATGICGDKVPPVMGVPFHGWSLLLFLLAGVLVWFRRRRTA